MIGSLRGTLIDRSASEVLVEVCGVGYRVTVTPSTSVDLGFVGSEVFVHIHHHVREDAQTLYGFSSRDERVSFEEFVQEHPREPLPDKVSWQTERTDRYNRAHWLVIDRLGAVPGESHLVDTNLLQRGRELDFGLRISSAVDRGRRAHEVVQGSNAFQVGLRQGDRLVEINGTTVQTGRDIAEGMEAWEVGDPLRFVVERDGKRLVLEGVFQPIEVDLPPAPIFPRKKPSGRVDLVRLGNVVEASTEGVRAFTVLLSPSVFDFRRPIRVVANGRPVFDGLVEPSVATMLKWAARDNDRTMLFGAELNIDLGK